LTIKSTTHIWRYFRQLDRYLPKACAVGFPVDVNATF